MKHLFFSILFCCTVSCSHRQRANSAFSTDHNLEQTAVLFHPNDPTLETIAAWLNQAQERIDIAIYNMDTSDDSPVIKALKAEQMQLKIRQGNIKIRLIFEGYTEPEDIKKRMIELEQLGIDVHHLSSNLKVHHKFAVIDGHLEQPRLITGSANWSLNSYRNYDEALLFFSGYKNLTQSFQQEFNLIWQISQTFGNEWLTYPKEEFKLDSSQEGLISHFNSKNFKVTNNKLVKDDETPGFYLTRQIVKAIDGAQAPCHLRIATTRIMLRPIYNALLRAADRSCKIEILVNMDQYQFKFRRAQWQLDPECDRIDQEYDRKCSTDVNFSHFLDSKDFAGKENVTVRIKFFNFSPAAYLTNQMHSKYIIVNDDLVLSGSFNWSYSSEYSHLENIVEITGRQHPQLIDRYIKNHNHIFNLRIDEYQRFLPRIEQALRSGQKTDCTFKPMALEFTKIDYLLDSAKRIGEEIGRTLKLKDACL